MQATKDCLLFLVAFFLIAVVHVICQLLNSLFVLCFEPVFFQEFCFQSAISLSAFPKVSSFNYILKLEICISSHPDHLPLSLEILMLVVTMQCSLLLMPSGR